MKQISTGILLFVLSLTAQDVLSQEQEYRHSFSNNSGFTLEFFAGRGSDVHVEGYDGNEVIVENRSYEPPTARPEGLRPLYTTGGENTGIGLSVEESGGTLSLITANREDGDYYLRIPNRVRLVVEEVNWSGGDFWVSDHSGEVEIRSKTGSVHMSSITGPVVVSSTSGDVEVDFSTLSQAGPTSISLISGFIDITLPEESEADFQLSSISGEIYTDLDIELNREVNISGRPDSGQTRTDNPQDIVIDLSQGFLNNLRGNQIDGVLNDGGVDVTLKSISEDIYLRSK